MNKSAVRTLLLRLRHLAHEARPHHQPVIITSSLEYKGAPELGLRHRLRLIHLTANLRAFPAVINVVYQKTLS